MVKASIYYNPFEHPSENDKADSLWWQLRDHDRTHVYMTKKYFEKWKFMGTEEIKSRDDFHHIYHKYNTDGNPLATPEGQAKVRRLGTHTSMSMQDIIKVGNAHYMVASVGFLPVVFVNNDVMHSEGQESYRKKTKGY